MQLSDQDQHIVREIWDADLSLCEVWRTHKGAQALAKVPFEGATAEYLNHLRTAERSPLASTLHGLESVRRKQHRNARVAR